MKVFLSHAREDTEKVRVLTEQLQQQGFEIWSDQNILPGDDFAKQISEALQSSQVMIVVLSPAAGRSDQVRREIEYAIQSPRYAHRLLPVVIEATDDVPWILRKMPWIDLTKEPKEGVDKLTSALRAAVAS